ncbi:MarR family transcriptional regulator [Gemmata sp. JC717]|uniref:MarR family winged helix-turn-helix transcriptional regulator n=1 Tax=Gemmata algarum TaxID=2975278 RepID=UPI0021BB5FDD|nr:MarR family transcriptional regulator [Gemmata algarum]MDY3554062.1 MarR family transcriptional regulator [Gemmata algarum]
MSTVPSPLDAHIGFWLRYVSNHVSHAFATKVEGHGVTVAEWVVLRQLLGTGATAPSALAEELGLTRGAVSKLVDRLLAKNLVSRAANRGDKRFQTVALTPTGREIVPRLAALADANDAEFFGHLSAEQRTMLMGLMKDVVRRHGLKDVPVE